MTSGLGLGPAAEPRRVRAVRLGWITIPAGVVAAFVIAIPVVVVGLLVLVAIDSWTPATTLVAPTPAAVSVLWDRHAPIADGAKSHSDVFYGVVCPPGGNCVAYGNDLATDDAARPLLVTQHGSTWTPMTLSLPAGAAPWRDSISEVDAVSCIRKECIALGDYKDAHQVLHVFSNTFAGHPSTTELPISADAEHANELGTGPDEDALVSLSCWSTTGCLAAITINFDDGEQDRFELLRFDGTKWSLLPNPQIPLSTEEYGDQVDQVSCTAQGWCALAGHGTDSMGESLRAWSAVPSGKTWKARLDRDLQVYEGLSCTAAGPCRALAFAGSTEALVTITKSGATTTTKLPRKFDLYGFGCSAQRCAFSGPADEKEGGYLGTSLGTSTSTTRAQPNNEVLRLGNPGTVACASSSFCLAVGGYQIGPFDAPSAPLIEVFSKGSWRATTPSAPGGLVTGTLNGVACQSAAHCVAIGQWHGDVSP